jgi:glycosyltransferase involved in cell wall biosynthesis
MDMDHLGIVVIGRNEGERLCLCLKSIYDGTSCPVIYVDSGSTDNSVAIARSLGGEVWELDSKQSFSLMATVPLQSGGLMRRKKHFSRIPDVLR